MSAGSAPNEAALKAYRVLTGLKAEGKTLNPDQEQTLEKAERALGQSFIPGTEGLAPKPAAAPIAENAPKLQSGQRAVQQSMFDTGKDQQQGQNLLFGGAVADHPDVQRPLSNYLGALRQAELPLSEPGQFEREYQTDFGKPPPPALVARAKELEVRPGEADQGVGNSPQERFQNHLDLADRIAGGFYNTPGIQPDDARQVARMALDRAANRFDPTGEHAGVPFRGYASSVIRNGLRDQYKAQMRRAVEQPTLDQPIDRDNTDVTGKDQVQSKEPLPSESAAKADAHSQLRGYIDRVSMAPESRGALHSLLDGKDQSEIAEDLGVSPQRVSAMIGTGLEQLRKVFAEKGIQRGDLIGGGAIGKSFDEDEPGKDDDVYDATGNRGERQTIEDRAREGDPSAVADVIRGHARTSPDEPRSASIRAAERTSLIQHAVRNDRVVPHPSLSKDEIARGAEHVVYRDGDRVLKVTKPGDYGIGLNGGGRATPGDYFERLGLQNRIFGDDARFEGVASRDGEPQIVTSQSHLQGEPPTSAEIIKLMTDKGFEWKSSDSLKGGYWYRENGNVIARDTEPKNFVKTPDGQVHPIDLALEHPNRFFRKALNLPDQGEAIGGSALKGLADDTEALARRLETEKGVNAALAQKARQLADYVRSQTDPDASARRTLPDDAVARADLVDPGSWPQAWRDEYEGELKKAGIHKPGGEPLTQEEFDHPARKAINDAFDAKHQPEIDAARARVDAKNPAPDQQHLFGAAVKDDAEAFRKGALGFKSPAKGERSPTPNAVAKAFRDVGDGVVKVFAPHLRGEDAAFTARTLSAHLAEAALSHYRDQIAFESASKLFARKPAGECLAFIDAIEKGTPIADPAMNEIAQRLRAVNDQKVAAARSIPSKQFRGFIENYFPHIFEKGEFEEAQAFYRRKIEGSRAFLKHRSIPTVAEALAIRDAAGNQKFHLESNNPIDLFLKRWGHRLTVTIPEVGLIHALASGRSFHQATASDFFTRAR